MFQYCYTVVAGYDGLTNGVLLRTQHPFGNMAFWGLLLVRVIHFLREGHH